MGLLGAVPVREPVALLAIHHCRLDADRRASILLDGFAPDAAMDPTSEAGLAVLRPVDGRPDAVVYPGGRRVATVRLDRLSLLWRSPVRLARLERHGQELEALGAETAPG